MVRYSLAQKPWVLFMNFDGWAKLEVFIFNNHYFFFGEGKFLYIIIVKVSKFIIYCLIP